MDRIDLANGSFFALHRPLLSVTDAPIDAQQSSFNDYGGELIQAYVGLYREYEHWIRKQFGRLPVLDIEYLTSYFSTLRPFTPPNPVHQGPVSNKNAEQAVQDFFRQISGNLSMSIDGQSTQTMRESIMDDLEETNAMHMTSVLRKRRIKMRKHKYKKLRKRTRALRKKLGK
ncbi:hypothetical protein BGZ99_001928 [Dissophora globulifera]|uniref:Small ribosomal subunit protein mS38 n=1 Tax=Dissophora globulifera TaxID=979702 RepID=A0A9P6RNH3_9FUNG|nr:hypothetical protein BGZ99_001928 [Dissophora globulifera]